MIYEMMYEFNFSLRDLEVNYPDDIWLPISPELKQKAYEKSQKNSHPQTRHNAYLNYITVNSMLTYINDWLDEARLEYDNTNDNLIKIKVFKQNSFSSIWEFINGSVIEVNGIKIALIPSDNLDINEICIPQEWLEIPDWKADYYLPIQINLDNPEESWLRVFGCIDFQQLTNKNLSEYEPEDKAFYINKKHFNLKPIEMLMMIENRIFNPQVESSSVKISPECKLLSNMSEEQINLLINNMRQYSLDYPRLNLCFDEWKTILTHDNLREKFYEKRVNPPILLRQWLNQKEHFNLIDSKVIDNIKKTVILAKGEMTNITNKTIDLAQKQWQDTEEFFNALNLSHSCLNPARSNLEITEIFNLLQPNQPQQIRTSAINVLGGIKNNDSQTIEILTNLINNDADEDIRYHAALTLAKLQPSHPQGGVKNLHLIDLGFQLQGNPLALVVAIIPKSSQKMGIWLEVKPINNDKKLPFGLTMSILSESGETQNVVTARKDKLHRDKDDLIQQRFTLPSNTYFQVKVCLNESCFIREFFA